MSARLLDARSAVLRAGDVRMAAADRAMVALHATPTPAQPEVDRLFTVWRAAHDEYESAKARLAMAKAAANPASVVALPSERAS